MIFLIWADRAHDRELDLAEALLATSCRIDRLNYRQPDSVPEPELLETDRELAPPDSVQGPELPVPDPAAATTSVTDREVETTSEMM